MNSNRDVIVRLFQEGRKQSDIARSLNLSMQLVSKAIKRYKETGSNKDRPGKGRKRNINITKIQRKIKSRIQRNPRTSTRKLAKSTGISKSSTHRILKNVLHLKAYKLKKANALDDNNKATRLDRCKAMKRRFANGRHRSILFSDEKIFTIEQAYNSQNDRIWSLEAPTQEERIVSRKQKPKSVMIWAGVTHNGKTPLVFVDDNMKINKESYRAILETKLLPWAQEHFGEDQWTFQQDSAPAHKSKDTQNWIRSNFPDFISKEEWPPYSPDLNPMDYSIWSILESKACAKPHKSVKSLKLALKKEWNKLSLETLKNVVDNFPKRLDLCIKAGGGHFE